MERVTSDTIPQAVRELRAKMTDEQWKRFQKICADGHQIWWVGASNPSGVLRTAVEMIDFLRGVRFGQDWFQMIACAPLRMTLAQVGSLIGTGSGGYESTISFDTHVDLQFLKAVVEHKEEQQTAAATAA